MKFSIRTWWLVTAAAVTSVLMVSASVNIMEPETNVIGNVSETWFLDKCFACRTMVYMMRTNLFPLGVKAAFMFACESKFEYQVCNGLWDLFRERLFFISTASEMTPDEVCGLSFDEACFLSDNPYPYHEKWIVPLLPIPDDVTRILDNLSHHRNYSDSKINSEILHLSDLHLDMYYQFGTFAGCGEPLCCRANSSHTKFTRRAGYWGALQNCDSPLHTIDNMLGTITENYSDRYRVVLLTGDYLPHDIWKTTVTEIYITTREINKLLRKNIPKDKIVIPVIGNHESTPINQFCPPTVNNFPRYTMGTAWLYEELLKQWNEWIPKEYHDTFRKFGYYSVSNGKARYIVLNTNYCARLNFWNAMQYVDLGEMLQWLQMELNNATLAGQYVYIVGHIAPDNHECTQHWVWAYREILERYGPVIQGQFFGHTHYDEIRIYYSGGAHSKPIGMAYLAPSVTTYTELMPAFRFYQTDLNTGEIYDHQTFSLNITEANNGGTVEAPKWNFEYSARDRYGFNTTLTPQAWHDFIERAKTEQKLLQEYFKNYGRASDAKLETVSHEEMIEILPQVTVDLPPLPLPVKNCSFY